MQIATKVYYKLRQLNYYKLRQNFIQITTANLLQITTILLQTTTAITNRDKFITNYDSHYKLRQLLQITTEHPALVRKKRIDFAQKCKINQNLTE